VEASEREREIQRHEQNSGRKDEHLPGAAQVEVADATNEQVTDGEVQEAPKDVERRGR
jgi:hypothetical protein